MNRKWCEGKKAGNGKGGREKFRKKRKVEEEGDTVRKRKPEKKGKKKKIR